MTRPPRQSDIVRAIRAAQSTGVTVARIEVTQDGRIVIIAADPYAAPADVRLL